MTILIAVIVFGVIIAIIVLLFSNTLIFNLAISVISAIIIYELFQAEKCWNFKISSMICMIYILIMPFMTISSLISYRYFFAIICIFALFISYLVQHKNLNFDKLAFMITTTSLVSMSMCCIISIKNLSSVHGIFYIVLTLAGAWIADSGAYFVGTAIGKHKLSPEISPKKTVEGALGGIIINGIAFALFGFVYSKIQSNFGVIFDVNYPMIIIIGMVSAVLGILGDLSASLLKRQCQIKDYGKIMPGHGGMLDRFDSVLFVAPFMSIVLAYVNIF